MRILIKIFKFLLLFPLLTACNTSQGKLQQVTSTSSPVAFPSAPILSKVESYPQPVKCQLITSTGLPVSDNLKSSHVLYQAGESQDSPDQVWAYSIKDRSRKLLLDKLPYPYYVPGFLIDGFHFVLVDKGRLWLSDLQGSTPELINSSDPASRATVGFIPRNSNIWRIYNNWDDSWSPDGSKSAIWKLGDPNLVIQSRSNGNKVNIFPYDNRGSISGSWSPDGTSYAFTYSRPFAGEKSSLYIVNADGTNLRTLVQFEPLELGRPHWSPDGQSFVFTSYKRFSEQPIYFQVYSFQKGMIETFAVDAVKSLTGLSENDIVWSPDNQWFLFFTEEDLSGGKKYDIEVLNVKTAEVYCITNDNLVEVIADWR